MEELKTLPNKAETNRKKEIKNTPNCPNDPIYQAEPYDDEQYQEEMLNKKQGLIEDLQIITSQILSACQAYQAGKIKSPQFIFLVDKYMFQFRILDSAPEHNLIKEMVHQYFADFR